MMRDGLLAGSLVAADRRLAGIHGLRAAAALMVVAYHVCGGIPGVAPPSLWFVTYFQLGPHLFFVLSAFSLAYSTKISAEGLGEYAIKRFFRIAPLFYVMMVFFNVQQGWQGLSRNILNASFFFNFIPNAFGSVVLAGWTIGVEMIFYAILPIILLTVRSLRGFVVLAIASALISWTAHIVISQSPYGNIPGIRASTAQFFFASNFVVFCFGLLAFAIYRQSRNRVRDANISAIVAVVLIGAVLLTPLKDILHRPGRPDYMLLYAAFGAICLWQASRPSWLLATRAAQYVGERSYSIYLLHLPLIRMTKPVYVWIYDLLPFLGKWAYVPSVIATALAVIALSNVTYHLIEVPGVNLGRRIIERRRSAETHTSDQRVGGLLPNMPPAD